ncbi:hypothetical protein CERSUDRAFT_100344 [Gelatoporia subvermispora B]|uniref:Uncharacterized protein n=1 Tax=Ceriporiopsis subvermispora (strain B) TaxID=914234 RepID=M2Q3Y1_CERS8|nr:hypothetical protein CERSUDRAFT_100344 [Gelatoporia subvermispora B]
MFNAKTLVAIVAVAILGASVADGATITRTITKAVVEDATTTSTRVRTFTENTITTTTATATITRLGRPTYTTVTVPAPP